MKTTLWTKIYAAFAIAGTVATWCFNIQYMRQSGGGFDVGGFIAGGYANPAAASLSTDLLIGSAAFMVWMVVEARRLGMRHWWICVVAYFVAAFACAAPLFFAMREQHLARGRGERAAG